MPTSIELRRLFLRELARQAPDIVHDLFKRDDAKEWAARWGILSQWVIDHAEWSLNFRSGNREGIRKMRERGVKESILAAWQAAELRTWEAMTHPFIGPPPPLEIPVFDEDEDFRYLKPAELSARVKKTPRRGNREISQGRLRGLPILPRVSAIADDPGWPG